jgi:hypothetical protein
MGVPDGGERDTTPPVIISHDPPLEATRIAGDADLTLRFNKYMDRASVRQAAFFSPPLDGTVKWRWRGRSVRITHDDDFAVDRTTVMTLGAGVRDYIGNEMQEPFALAFSTSAELEMGELRARVTGLSGRETAELWLVDSIHTAMTPLHVLPVTAGASQRRFRYLPEGGRELVAVQDLNRDRQWDPFSERIALPHRAVQVPDTSRVQLLHLHYSFPDTVMFRSVRQLNSRVIQLQGYFPDSLSSTEVILQSRYEGVVYSTELLCANSSQAWLLLLEPLSADSVVVTMEGLYSLPEIALKQTAHVDSLVPEMLELTPLGRDIPPGREVTVTAGEPLQLANWSGVRVIVNESDTLAASGFTPFAEGSIIQFEQEWSWGDSCRVWIDPLSLKDASGNMLPDTLRKRGFIVREHDSLGGLAGEVSGLDVVEKTTVDLLALDGAVVATVAATPVFRFEEIPAGDYMMRLYRDTDNSGDFSAGSVKPFQYAEPYLIVRDTFQVAPRWIVEGLRLNGEEMKNE